MLMRALALLLLLPALCCAEDLATERYAPAQISVAQDLLQRARAAAARGDASRAGKLAWQASLDARLAWGMTDSAELRADAARVGGEASALIEDLARP
jgi:hypothetical protein